MNLKRNIILFNGEQKTTLHKVEISGTNLVIDLHKVLRDRDYVKPEHWEQFNEEIRQRYFTLLEGDTIETLDTHELFSIHDPQVACYSFSTPVAFTATLIPVAELIEEPDHVDEGEDEGEHGHCPKCNADFLIPEDVDPADVICPECGYRGEDEEDGDKDEDDMDEQEDNDDEDDEEDEDEDDDSPDYNSMSLKSLKVACRAAGHKISKGTSREQMIKLLTAE